MTVRVVNSSFRDPAGSVYIEKGEIYRLINPNYQDHYDELMGSGLYDALAEQQLICRHEEVPITNEKDRIHKIIRPETIPFISYPHEWCFNQLKDAALTTIRIQKIALSKNMTLKDASAYNIQFQNGRPVLIDTLSFEKHVLGRPWVAYEQFCRHFLAPLALMTERDVRLAQLFRIYMEGIPLDLASLLLGRKTFFRFHLLLHIHLHAKAQKRFGSRTVDKKRYQIGPHALIGLISSLERSVKKLDGQKRKTEWSDYYEDIHYAEAAIGGKIKLVSEFIGIAKPAEIWDLGANTGLFSRLATRNGIMSIAFDADHAAVERNYLDSKNQNDTRMLPLVMDFANPTSAFGWSNEERMSLMERGPTDLALALALVHHLRITGNVPLSWIARFFSKICKWLIIEFVPKLDPKVQLLLRNREDVYSDYSMEGFEASFATYFETLKRQKLQDSERILYLLCRVGP
jgi:hypothetical protein